MDWDEIKDSWEDDSIVGSGKEKESGESEEENEGRYVKHNWSKDSGDTIVPNDSMETDDREYEPTTTDSEESVISTPNKLLGRKKQTTLTMTFKEASKEKIL